VEGLADHIGVLRNGALRAQMSRDDLNANLRRYRVEVPDGWNGIASLNGTVLRRVATPREVQWTVWGPEAEIVQKLTSAGGTVREVARLSLIDATLALLNPND